MEICGWEICSLKEMPKEKSHVKFSTSILQVIQFIEKLKLKVQKAIQSERFLKENILRTRNYYLLIYDYRINK